MEKNKKNNNQQNAKRIGVIIMTYGSATRAEHVEEYFKNIYGANASAELIHDFENRYRLTGGSPLIKITKEQAMLLEKELNQKNKTHAYIVRAGMRHSSPTIAEAILECHTSGVERMIGIVLSPQFSSIIMEGYRTTFLQAAKDQGFADDTVVIAGPWGTEPHFIELLSKRVENSLDKLHKKYTDVPVIFTTHSLPERVVAKDPGYIDQLKSTIDAVCEKLGYKFANGQDEKWYAGYQSAGHTPEPWLKPDLTDILDQITKKELPTNVKSKTSAVLIVPIQFLTDHLEILYDLDIAAKEQCRERGIEYNRIELPNTDSLFIKALAAITKTY